ncbi:MAG: YdeI/OmpD-associated family protein [Rhodanobacter sp.]
MGFYKKGSGQPSMSWKESVDEALCVGWIDGRRSRIDDLAYMIRFTPRKRTSIWSAVNVERVGVLQAEGRMRPAGFSAFNHRREAKSGIYAHEQKMHAQLTPEDEALFRRHKKAWEFFEAQPPGYRHLVVWGILSAKRQETKSARLARLIAASEQGVRL